MQQAAAGVDVLDNADNVKILSNVLKTNVAACVAIGPFFLPQLGRIWLDMLGLYGAASNTISEAVATQGMFCALYTKSGNPFPNSAIRRSRCHQDSQGPGSEDDQERDSQTC